MRMNGHQNRNKRHCLISGEQELDAHGWFGHNDMHGGNIFFNPYTNKVSMLDMGMAQDNPMAALLEAIGGVTDEDYQLSSEAGLMNFEDTGVRQGFKDRLFELQQELEDEMTGDYDVEDPEGMDIRDRIGDLFQ